MISRTALLQLIINAASNNKLYIYYDSKIHVQTQDKIKKFSLKEMDAGYAMINMTIS